MVSYIELFTFSLVIIGVVGVTIKVIDFIVKKK